MNTVDGLTFTSGGDTLLGTMFSTEREIAAPLLLLLHGFPGIENNFDLAHEARRSGWNVFTFHYRGAWGSDGSFSFRNCLDDARAALEYLRSPEIGARYDVDTRRMAVAGHSMGGFIALHTAANDPALLGAASWAGYNFGIAAPRIAAHRDATARDWHGALAPLRGARAEALVDEAIGAGSAWDLRDMAPRLEDRPILLVGARHDTIAPVELHHEPLVDALTGLACPFTHAVLDTEHGFTSHRLILARMLVQWLQSL